MTDFSSQQPWGIPDHWEWSKVANLGEVVSGGTPSTKVPEYWNGGINWLSPADLSGYQKKYIASGAKSLSRLGLENSSARLMPKGSVLYSSRAPVGYVAIASDDLATNQGFKSLVPADGLDSEYLYYYFKASKRLAESRASGTTFKEISGKAFAGLPVPIAPAPQQRRIVAKIEELFSELDKGIESLRTARAQLKTYRQSLLKAAFEGRLTEQWRRENADKLEPVDQLLARIRKEREARYQQQLEAWKAEMEKWEAEGKLGKKPAKPNKPGTESSLTDEQIKNLPELPHEWAWVNLAAIQDLGKFSVKAGPFGSALKKEFYVPTGYKIYGQEQVIRGDHNFGEYYINDAKYRELEACAVKPHDVLISLVGTIGKVLVLPDDASPGIINPRLVKISLDLDEYSPLFFKAYFESEFLRSIYSQASQGTTMDVLNLGIIRSMPFPICSLKEQREVLQAIEAKFAEVERMDQTITTTLQQAETLRQSILKRAFEGKLVPQDPDDEPATELLARIRVEHEREEPKRGKRKRRKKC